MDIRVLRYFLTTARAENITRAAETLHISQPSLSKQLMELEEELGKQLLVRGKRKITLTEDGILLRKRAEEIVSLLEKTEQELSADRAALSGTISIGGLPGKAVLQAAAALRAAHPELCFHFYSGDATEILERLDHGSLDLAVLLEPVDTVNYEYLSLADSAQWGLLLPEGCALAARGAVDRQTLCRVPLIMHRRVGLQRAIAHWAQAEMEQMNVAATYNVVDGDPAAYVRSGLGYFLTSDDHLPSRRGDGLCFRPLTPPLTVRHALVWKRYADLSKAAAAFLAAVQAEIENGRNPRNGKRGSAQRSRQ